jgi:allophanate hydrolase
MTSMARTLSEIRQSLIDGTLTVHGLVARFFEAQRAGAPSAWISLQSPDFLAQQADECDRRLRELGADAFAAQPLLGIPFAVKDNIDVAGLPTTAACPSFVRGAAVRHATVVQRLVDAGALPVGKTNLDQFATGLVGTRSPYGAVPNPFDPAYVSGGSSSGSAYVVSTGQVPFALGTDTAGSGRVPAGFCQVAGLKPTRGWLSTHGVLPACRSLDCPSVFALTPQDAWLVAALAAGPDPHDPYSRTALPPLKRTDRLAALRLGLPDRLEFFGDDLAARAFAAALALVEGLGCRIVRIPFAPLERVASLLYQGPWVAERFAAVGDFLSHRPSDADPAVLGIVLSGAMPLAHALFSAQDEIKAVARRTAALWEDIDFMLVPSAPNHPTQAQVQQDPLGPNRRLGHYTNFVNLLDLAAHAFPGPARDDGLPAGVTLIGPAFSDLALARVAAQLVPTLQPLAGAVRHPVAPVGSPVPALRAVPPPAGQAMRLVLVGAHMEGLALNWQLQERAARCVARTRTAACYRLYSLTGQNPTRPALVHVGAAEGRAIEVEVWEMDLAHVGSFLALVGPPLALGRVELDDGSLVNGFVCEPRGVAPGSVALDITHHGGWRPFLAALQAGVPSGRDLASP